MGGESQLRGWHWEENILLPLTQTEIQDTPWAVSVFETVRQGERKTHDVQVPGCQAILHSDGGC